MALAVLALCATVGCSGANDAQGITEEKKAANASPDAPGTGRLTGKVLHFVNGNLGDKGFYDSAERGLRKASYVYGFKTETVEGGTDPDAWEPRLAELIASNAYEVIVVGTSTIRDVFEKLALQYPKQQFVFYDDKIEGLPNVYAMVYSQSEGSFLAGAFAAMATTDESLKNANPEKAIGFIGGIDAAIIHDFQSGYEQGAAYIDPQVRVVSAYVGDFTNQAKAEALAREQYESGKVDIIYNAAGGAGLGMLKEGDEQRRYSIGVDSNQNGYYPGSVLASILKNVDESVFRALSEYRGGRLPFGKTEELGVREGGVGIARDELYEKHVPEAIKAKMKEIEAKIASGEIRVRSSLKNEAT
ncbi:basic membrane protein A [Paenibacillus methanolicus]|uniref:Basic membrane protein A n=2 Tax=Paenibacillus methanolicus TaxID=582686 RepID=A0A5S5BYF3_9BACL|nr:basic membrane protein A [Paenibacillus methanolicus]